MTSQTNNVHDDDVVLVDRDDISNYNPKQLLPQPAEEIKKIRSWLQATDYAHPGGEYRKHLGSHMPGTGSWLTSSATYNSWLKSTQHGTLWIKGIPGSGKSVFAAHLINTLTKAHPGQPVLYFFFRQIIDANHEPSALLRDWLDQILEYSPPLQLEFKEIIKNNRSLKSMAMEDLWSHLELAIRNLPERAFCIADALDEMDSGHADFLKSLGTFAGLLPGKAKIVMTSRPITAIETSLQKINLLRIRLDETMVDTDISHYVERGLKTSHFSAADQNLVRSAVPGRANGIFLYAKLAMDSFLEPGANADEVLRALPVDLHDMYTTLLREHARRSDIEPEIQLLILQWVTHATRPLRLLELAEIVYISCRQSKGTNTCFDLKTAKELVRDAVGPLLEILPNETVCVIHHSFTEYLKCMTRSEFDGGYPILRQAAAHGRLALTCIEYLQAGCLDGVQTSNQDGETCDTDASKLLKRTRELDHYTRGSSLANEEQRLRLQHPFYAYAAAHWHVHVIKSCAAGLEQRQINLALHRFFTDDRRTKAWLKLHWSKNEEASKSVTPLHIAARYGLTDFAGYLEPKDFTVDAVDVLGRTPLWWAAHGGHANTIRLLVQAGADPDMDEKPRGLKPLHEASSKNHAEAVRALLEAGVDPLTPKAREDPGRFCGNAPRSTGHTPLMYACHNGHLEALEAFLPFIKNPEVVHRALAWSASHGRSKLVRRLLQHPGVDPNAKVRGDTILYSACKALDHDSIIALIEAGASPKILSVAASDEFAGMGWYRMRGTHKARDEIRGSSPLHALCGIHQRGYTRFHKVDTTVLQDIFDMLLQNGAPIGLRTDDGRTALHTAVQSPVLTRLLVGAGADANATDDNGYTPLHSAEYPESVAILVEEGNADINAIARSDNVTPILRMLDRQHKDAIKKLLEYRPNLSIKHSNGKGPLHFALASYSSDISTIQALLAAGADPDERNRAGDTPLLAVRMDNRGAIKIVDLLLRLGADINARDRSGYTVLSRTVRSRAFGGQSQHADIQQLLDRGARVQVRDHKGRTLLHHAVATHDSTRSSSARHNDVTRLDYVLGLGLDVQKVDHHGNTIIHEAALRSNIFDTYNTSGLITLWERLLCLGVDINQANFRGRTALHILAASRGDRYGSTPFVYNVGYVSLLDFVVSRVEYIDQSDSDGLTALHLASTVSEYVTKKLLDAGADSARSTIEGFTPLHLAARARQSNIVGMLLSIDHVKAAIAINAKDEKGNSPLYYACRSGRPETVRLLLDARADATNKDLWLACAEFEDEERLWSRDRHHADIEVNGEAGGLTINDNSRPGPLPDTHQHRGNKFHPCKDTTRIEETLNMLAAHKCNPEGLIGGYGHFGGHGAIPTAAYSGHDYTLRCLIQVRDVMLDLKPSITSSFVLFRERVVALQSDAVKTAAVESALRRPADPDNSLVEDLLKARQYHLMRPLFENGVNFLTAEKPALEFFVQHGFATLLDEIGTLEVDRRLEEGKWHSFGDRLKPGLFFEADLEPKEGNRHGDRTEPMLSTAIKRQAPNMDVVRLLVEKFDVDVNEHLYMGTYTDNTHYSMVQQGTVLHELAPGKHWWHAFLAIPYLLSRKADTNARNNAGQTPLHVALGGSKSQIGPFHKDAARALVSAGADVNARDERGISCLASTAGDLEMMHLLLSHDAEVTADTLFMAIHTRRVEALKVLLETGANPNMRVKDLSPPTPATAKSRKLSLEQDAPAPEEYPLYYAATHHGLSGCSKPLKERTTRWSETEEIMRALLSAGANPHAAFLQWNGIKKDVDRETEDPSVSELLRDGRVAREALSDTTIVHALLDQNEMVHPILELDTLDANQQDAQGRTLLHMACHQHDLREPIDSLSSTMSLDLESSRPSYLDCLLAHGADPLAVDLNGNNILHHMFLGNARRNSYEKDPSTVAHLAKIHSGLVNQVNADGRNPLHMALKHAALHLDTAAAEALLDAGANPFATDNHGNGCLHTLAFSIYKSAGVRSLFTKLLHMGLDVNARNERGETPIFNLNKHLSGSTSKANERIEAAAALSLFEDAGADLFARDNSGKGLLHVAAKETCEPVKDDRFSHIFNPKSTKPTEPSITRFKLLLSRGLDPMLEDVQRRTPLDVAAACGKESVLQLFEKGETRVVPMARNDLEDDDDDSSVW